MTTVGNTVRITGTFKDWDDNLSDAPDVKLIIYDGGRSVIEEIEPEDIDHVSTGTYRYHYIIPESPPGRLTFEFSSPSAPDGPIVGRTEVDRQW